MTGKGDGLFGDAFLQAAIAVEGEDVVVEDGVIGGVELGRGAFAGEREADRIADTLAEWPSGGFDALGVAELRVTRCFGAELAEVFHFIQGQRTARKVQPRVQKH